MNSPSTKDRNPTKTKRSRLKSDARKIAIPALQLAGYTQNEIAEELGVHRSTVTKDLEEIQPATDQLHEIMGRAQKYLEKVWPLEKRIDRMAFIGEHDKNGAVSLAAVGMGNSMAGMVDHKELVRTRRDDAATTLQPMFVLPAGSQISVTVDTTTYSNKDSSSSTQEPARNVTPTVTPDTK